jgi:hypothetical protein
MTDGANCGGCGQACGAGQSCSGGQCGAGMMIFCQALALCTAMCPTADPNCPGACAANATPTAVMLFGDLSTCVSQQCPSAQATDPCNTQGAACQMCQSMATAGACSGQYAACQSNMI